ncbi:hypothetical protein GCM10009654_64860 [Streptomyces hebeiensis]|uniref:Transposase IS200-like domain-containing protein n=1 Tax=Streptomyces hebeiensis TaxID=229486 RepID=A0ABN1V8F8_9ACTN
MRNVCTDFGADLTEFNGEEDHVHLLVHCPPKIALSALVNSLKYIEQQKHPLQPTGQSSPETGSPPRPKAGIPSEERMEFACAPPRLVSWPVHPGPACHTKAVA